jgi:hypothetical protein
VPLNMAAMSSCSNSLIRRCSFAMPMSISSTDRNSRGSGGGGGVWRVRAMNYRYRILEQGPVRTKRVTALKFGVPDGI